MEHIKTVVRPRDQHSISRKNIDPDALTVLYRLKNSGYAAYLVGGGVRDLLIGRKPKDFDVGTDAHPRRVRDLFRNSFLIGRRFKLVHVKFGTKVIEVSTFRKKPDPPSESVFEPGALLQFRDNTFGTPVEDACRRDFTINGLFYDIRTFGIIDHVGGLEDIDHRTIRSIGDPEIRFQEDPVRMIRALRFAARLGFRIEQQTWDAILRHHQIIMLASHARLLEEIFRLFPYGSGRRAFELLDRSGLLNDIMPEVVTHLAAPDTDKAFFWNCLAALDARRGLPKDSEPLPRLMLATVFLPLVLAEVSRLGSEAARLPLSSVASEVLRPFSQRFHLPKSIFFPMMFMFDAQRRFRSRPFDNRQQQGGKLYRFTSNEAFPDAVALRHIHLAASGGASGEPAPHGQPGFTELLDEWQKLHSEHKSRGGGQEQLGSHRRHRPHWRDRRHRSPRP